MSVGPDSAVYVIQVDHIAVSLLLNYYMCVYCLGYEAVVYPWHFAMPLKLPS